MPNQEPMIKVQDVRFRYDPEQPKYAVDGVSLDIRRGEFVAVLGANGCGKSTLAKHFNAILLPEAGTVLVEAWTPATKTISTMCARRSAWCSRIPTTRSWRPSSRRT